MNGFQAWSRMTLSQSFLLSGDNMIISLWIEFQLTLSVWLVEIKQVKINENQEVMVVYEMQKSN